jgi:hypothetical protein
LDDDRVASLGADPTLQFSEFVHVSSGNKKAERRQELEPALPRDVVQVGKKRQEGWFCSTYILKLVKPRVANFVSGL